MKPISTSSGSHFFRRTRTERGKKGKDMVKRARREQIKRNALKIFSLILAVVVCSLLVMSSRSPPAEKRIVVEKGDIVKMNYVLWVNDDQGNPASRIPALNETLYVNVTSRYDPNRIDNSSGIILGLYNNILEKEEGYKSATISLSRCVDINYDGKDDETGTDALSYGHPADEFFNTSITIQFKVLAIMKKTEGLNSFIYRIF